MQRDGVFKPQISVIMPAYNAERFIDGAIRSVLNQSTQDWELLIVNDGSSDSTELQILKYSDHRIRYFKQKNLGVSVARNTALKQMSGEFYCFLDADDELPPESLQVRLRKFQLDKNVRFVDGAVKVFDAKMKKVVRFYKPSFKGIPTKKLLALSDHCFFGPSWMIRKSDEVFFRESLTHGEDLLYYVEISRKGGLYDYVDDDVYYYRSHSNSAMSNLSRLELGYKSMFSILKEFKEFSIKYQILFEYRSRKFMFLAYLAKGEFLKAFKALIL